jgi:hypothetical protein
MLVKQIIEELNIIDYYLDSFMISREAMLQLHYRPDDQTDILYHLKKVRKLLMGED